MNVGLVLAGGVAKGAYQAGFLKALEEQRNLHISAISGASIGLIGSYAFSAGKTDRAIELWEHTHFDTTVDLARSVWFQHYLRNVIKELVSEEDVLSIPIYAPICYLLPYIHLNYFRMAGEYHKKWRNFLLGAISFPVITGGVHFVRGKVAVDGGAMDNVPVLPLLKKEEPDVVLVLHFEAGYRPREEFRSYGVPIIDYDISIHNMFRKHSFDFHRDTLRSMIDSGYEYGLKVCDDLFCGGKNSLEQTLFNAERRKKEELPLRLDNVTFETWVQRLNSIFYPYVRRWKGKVYEFPKQKNCGEAQSVLQDMSEMRKDFGKEY